MSHHRCIETDCKAKGTHCFWSPLFRDADTGPRWLCQTHFDPHRLRADKQNWFIGDAARETFVFAIVVSREQSETSYQSAAIDLFRHGSHYGGVPLGSQLDPTHTAIYLLKGHFWVVTNRFAIGLPNAKAYLLRFRLPKEKVATGLTFGVACK